LRGVGAGARAGERSALALAVLAAAISAVSGVVSSVAAYHCSRELARCIESVERLEKDMSAKLDELSRARTSYVYVAPSSTANVSGAPAALGVASYIVWTDGKTAYARNCETGEVEFSGDAAAVIQRALNSVAGKPGGGRVVLLGGRYVVNSTIVIPPLKAGQVLEVEGLGLATIEAGAELRSVIRYGGASYVQGMGFPVLALRNIFVDVKRKAGDVVALDLRYVNVYLENVRVYSYGAAVGTGLRVGPKMNPGHVYIRNVEVGHFDVCVEIEADHVTAENLQVVECGSKGIYVHNCGDVLLLKPFVLGVAKGGVPIHIVTADGEVTIVHPGYEGDDPGNPLIVYDRPNKRVYVVGAMLLGISKVAREGDRVVVLGGP